MTKVEVIQVHGFPVIGTVEDPAFAWIDRTAYVAYQIAPIDGDGCALLQFSGVIEANILPLNTEGLFKNTTGPYAPEFGIKPWEINEIKNDSKSGHWKTLNARRWQMSFEDWTLDIIFEEVTLHSVNKHISSPDDMLRNQVSA
jgi:hypothetical protein